MLFGEFLLVISINNPCIWEFQMREKYFPKQMLQQVQVGHAFATLTNIGPFGLWTLDLFALKHLLKCY